MPLHSRALEIIRKLVSHGHTAYFAGGWVRDYLMGNPSDDIDIATSASPDEIVALFPKTLLVGIQFGVVIVLMEGHPYEVATFRKDMGYQDGRKPEHIEQTTPMGDALRRDFTINGMFYDPLEDKIHDFVGGAEDIARRVIRTIGNPHERFFEDRLRMIRAFRFAARFNFHMDIETEKAIQEHASKLFPSVAMERIWQEFSKMSRSPRFDEALIAMHRLNLLSVIFPSLSKLPDLKALKQYPKESSKALFLHELFPGYSGDQLQELGIYLKVPNKDLDPLIFYVKHLPFNPDISRYASAKFYADPNSNVSLAIYAAHLEKAEADLFLQKHEEKKIDLEWHIKRLIQKKPVLSSKDLFDSGVLAGISMGKLLKEGERLAIEEDLKDPLSVLKALKSLPLWNACIK